MKHLKSLWNKYKALKWWQKVLLALPFVIGIVLCFFFMFVPQSDTKKYNNHVDYHKKHVDQQVRKKELKEDLLTLKAKMLEKEEKELRQEIRRNEEEISDMPKRIENAASSGDFDELERIRRGLNSRSKRRNRT